jgi:predicted 3-demethylubiquinone-9 3-methyltransferase (glyoxalase superfamily)
MNGINICLGFNDKAEEAVNFYVSLFKNSKILKVTRFGKDQPGPEGSVCAIAFMLNGQRYLAVNGYSPIFNFTYGMSLMVECDTQEEIDDYWEKLSANGGQKEQCGWVKDKYGLSWQIIPTAFNEMMRAANDKQTEKLMAAVMKMKKLDIAEIEKAYAA